MAGLLWAIVVVLVVLWLLGFSMHMLSGFIWLILAIAVIVALVNLFTGGLGGGRTTVVEQPVDHTHTHTDV